MDTIIFEVIRSSLYSIAREMKAAVMRTAASPIIHDGGDASACVFDGDMHLVAQGNDVPTMLGSSVLSVRAAVNAIGVDELHPGDVIISNDAYLAAGNHQPDVQFTRPVFVDGKIIAYVMTKGHWLDIGGQTPGSHNISSWDIFGEGIRIPPLLLYRDERPRRDLVELLVLNTRDPGSRRLDIEAQYAGVFVGDQRLQALVAKYGAGAVREAMKLTLEHSERLMRKRIEAMADGVYEGEDWIEPVLVEGWSRELVPVRVKVTVRGDSMNFNYEGTGAQVRGGINAPYAVACNTTWFAVKAMLGEGIPINEGCYRPISIDVPEGTILNCKYPAAVVGGNTETSPRVVDLLFRTLSKALPTRVLADSSSAACAMTFSGHDPDKARCQALGRDYVNYMDLAPGGLGARPDKDGVNSIRVHVGNTGSQSIELVESMIPVTAEEWTLVTDSGGPGKYRGGLASRRVYRVDFDEATFSIIAERERVAPHGLFGGKPGTRYSGKVVRADGGEEVVHAKARATVVVRGDRVIVQSPGSGGFGDPAERDRAKIEDDIADGYVSEEAAAMEYGRK
jgi:N-methylhydantoinase B